MLRSFLFEIPDHRRAQGRRYQLGHILLFAILGILSGATSYRKIQQFIVGNYEELNEAFALSWKRMPAYTTVRDIIQRTSGADLEACFRRYSSALYEETAATQFIGCDGKVLKGSFDHFQDQKAIQILSAFLNKGQLILAHEEIETKTNEIPIAQKMIRQLGFSGCVFTFDALNCQKNASGS